MFPFKISIPVALAIVGFLSIGNGVLAAPKPDPTIGVTSSGDCKALPNSDLSLLNNKNSGFLQKVGENSYQARDSKGKIKWDVSIFPLRIASYEGQIGPYNAVSIHFGQTSYVFRIGEGFDCDDTRYQPYLDQIHRHDPVTQVMHHGMDRFP